jgi:hypothetical protein
MTVLLSLALLLLLTAFGCIVLALAKPAQWPLATAVAVLLLVIERLLTLLPLPIR